MGFVGQNANKLAHPQLGEHVQSLDDIGPLLHSQRACPEQFDCAHCKLSQRENRAMKMVMAVVPRDEAGRVIEALVSTGHTASFSDSRGGVLRQAQQMLFIAVENKDLERVLTIIRDNCHSRVVVETSEPKTPFSLGSTPVTAELGGAVVFIWDLDRFETY
jgi:uncharacterized protein YaaQ